MLNLSFLLFKLGIFCRPCCSCLCSCSCSSNYFSSSGGWVDGWMDAMQNYFGWTTWHLISDGGMGDFWTLIYEAIYFRKVFFYRRRLIFNSNDLLAINVSDISDFRDGTRPIKFSRRFSLAFLGNFWIFFGFVRCLISRQSHWIARFALVLLQFYYFSCGCLFFAGMGFSNVERDAEEIFDAVIHDV